LHSIRIGIDPDSRGGRRCDTGRVGHHG